MSVVQEIKFKDEEKSMDVNDVLEVSFTILDQILDFTKELEEKTPSVFDHIHQNHCQSENKNTDSTSCSDISSSDSDSCCKFERFDIEDFIIYSYKAMKLSPNLLILAMMNLDKLLAKQFILTSENIHKCFFICMMEAQKYYEDVNWTNKDYSRMCGISTGELLELELEFLKYIDFNIYVKYEDYCKYVKELKKTLKKNIIIRNTYIENE